MNNIFASIFGESPSTAKAREARNSAFQSMLASRRQAAEQAHTDNVKMARYNALGNVLTSMAQLGGWAAGGSTGNVQKYDDRQYIEAFNRAVKASDDIRNIGSAADEYRFKLADEDYKRAQALEDKERERAFKEDELERKYQQKLDEQQRKFENDMAKLERQGEIRQQIAEFNATHRIRSRATGQNADWRTRQKLLSGYLDQQKVALAKGEQFPDYLDWLRQNGFESLDEGGDGRESGGLRR